MGWIEKLDFEEAMREILKYEREGEDLCLDPLRFEELSISSVRKKLIESIYEKLRRNRPVEPLIEIDVPKPNYILRPGARPHIVDWIIYEALTNFIGKKVYKHIPDCSYSFNKFRAKFRRGKKKKKRDIDYWLDFENKAIEYSRKYRYMLVTDITSFFENISLTVLRERLLTIETSEEYVSAVNYLIENLLKPWTENNRVKDFGLPQGPPASHILADIYLYPVDREMREKRIVFFRYMDDIRIFTKTKTDLKKSLKYLVRALRDLKLNLNPKKTYIFDTSEADSLKKVFDPEKRKLNFIAEAFKSKNADQIIIEKRSLFDLFSKAKDPNNPFRERYFRFFISRSIDLMKFDLLEKTKIRELVTYFISLFEDEPHLTKHICWFLIAACNYDESLKNQIKDDLIKFISSSKNIYEWQEMWILDTLRQLNNLTSRDLRILKGKANSHELCQGQLALILGQSGNPDYREELLSKIKSEKVKSDHFRYFALAIQEMHEEVKRSVLRRVPAYFIEYLSKLHRPKYGFVYALSKIELEFEFY